jgi:lipopolysaccharide transport system ATP-binding protein
MSDITISVENVSKQYRLGTIGGRTLHDDLSRFWARIRKHPDPLLKIGERDYGNHQGEVISALRDINFQVKQGEVIGVIGRNGAGKSTLLKILSRITAPSTGNVKIKGRIGALLEVGTGFHPELTGRENIYLNGSILGMSKYEINQRLEEIIDFSGVEKFIDTPVKRYSSGMKVRLAFAVAAHLEPEILLVDEVLAVGDLSFQRKCLGKMQTIGREGRTILFVSHNMAAIRKLCPNTILIDRGTVNLFGSTDEVVSNYLESTAAERDAVVLLPSGAEDAPGTATCLKCTDRHGNLRSQFYIGEPWQIRLEFEIYRTTPHVIAAAGFMNFDSVNILTFWSQPKDLLPGKYFVEFTCNHPLSAAELQFGVGLSTNERAFYFVREIGHISISELSQTQQPFRAHGAGILSSFQDSEIKSLSS